MTFRLSIPGQPVPKARPRAGRFGRVYTPAATRMAENTIAALALAVGVWRAQGPIAVRLRFYRRDAKRVDIDNLAKLVLDALNGVAWADDSQIIRLEVSKHIDRLEPRTDIDVEQLTPGGA